MRFSVQPESGAPEQTVEVDEHATSERSIVLASGSTYRAHVLREAGWDVDTDPPDVDERAADELLSTAGPAGLALELARRKLRDVAPRHVGRLVVAADQVGVLDLGDRLVLLTKQPTVEGAVAQLCAMSGSTHRLVNGVAVTSDGGERVVEGVDEHVVTMRSYTRAEAEDYVRRFEPFDTSGSYRLEDGERMAPSAPLVETVEGEDSSGVLGLPLPLLARLVARLEEA